MSNFINLIDMNIDARKFLLRNLCDGDSYPKIIAETGIKRSQLSEWWEENPELRADIARANRWFNTKKNSPAFDYFLNAGRRAFFEWFDSQPKPRKCHYCGIEESKLEVLFNYDNPILSTARGRGRQLELERLDTANGKNVYTPDNCVLACYLCNNHKSDLISEEDHVRYFAPQIYQYLDDQFQQHIGQVSR